MPVISFLKPTDQPTNTLRLVDQLRENLSNRDFYDFRVMVAFVKLGPLLRLGDDIEHWNRRGKSIRAIFGVDHRGSSREALQYAMDHFEEVHVASVGFGPFNPTFHPKVYLFSGENKAVAYVGSNNLTVGGTETNLESYVKLDMDLPQDAAVKEDLDGIWADALRTALPLTRELLSELVTAGVVLDESQMRVASGSPREVRRPSTGSVFPGLEVVPPSTIPKISIEKQMASRRRRRRRTTDARPMPPSTAATIGAHALVIQIIPHHNGEVFLSKGAVDQDPSFFGWPFTGQTVPKRPSNPSYPQRVPDPLVDLRVYADSGDLVIEHASFGLNTVYYTRKSEIRITVPLDVVRAAPEYSILVMREGARAGLDYEMDIFVPGSDKYDTYLSTCNQTMPSGGRAVPRRFGWL